ncbi:MAG: glutamate--tRNA ligase family protein, partial [Bacteroidales bacterium]|nr:glutamate--tRNA ligase family protein [Bacteroidales bacterium]
YNHFTRGALRNSLSMPEAKWKRLVEERTDWTIRFKMPENRIVEMDDMVRGHIEVNSDTLDDKVLWKRGDELPTYHLANIVDDHLMEITEVIRGEEWLPSLPLHYLLYEAFGWTDTMPRFAHLSLLLKPDGKGKLSKRDGDRLGFPVFPLQWVNEEGEITRGYCEDGYFPEAFVNMLALLGWNPGDERELFTLNELVEAFSIERVIKSGAKFNPDKTKWFNKEYLRKKTPAELAELFIPLLEKDGYTIVPCEEGNCCTTDVALDFVGKTFPKCYVEKVIELTQDRATFVADFKDITSPLFAAPTGYEPKDVAKFWTAENSSLVLKTVDFLCGSDFGNADCPETIENGCGAKGWTKESVGAALEGYIRSNEWPMGKVMNCLRLILTGASSGLPIADIIWLIGKTEVLRRRELFVEAVK